MKNKKTFEVSDTDRRKTAENADLSYTEDLAGQEDMVDAPDDDEEYIVDYISADTRFNAYTSEEMQKYAADGDGCETETYDALEEDDYDYEVEPYDALEEDDYEMEAYDALEEDDYEIEPYNAPEEGGYEPEAYDALDDGYESEAYDALEEDDYEIEPYDALEEDDYEIEPYDALEEDGYEIEPYDALEEDGYDAEAYDALEEDGYEPETYDAHAAEDDYDAYAYDEAYVPEEPEYDADVYCGPEYPAGDGTADRYEAEDDAEDDDSFDTGFWNDAGAYDADASYAAGRTLSFAEKLKNWAGGLTAFDAVLASTGVVLVVAAVVILSMFLQSRRVDQQIEALAPLGSELKDIGIIGGDGLLAMADAAFSGNFAEDAGTEEEVSTPEAVDTTASGRVSVSFVSVQKDLKIRFTDADTGELITGTVFEVTLTNSKGKQLVLTDDDMDGIIYAQNVNPGVFDAVVTSTDKYTFPSVAQQVTVKDKVEYVVINDIKDEVKKESQVNVAAEDTQKNDAQKEEEKITDTVEWVEPSKTAIGGTESYLPVDKNTIADPAQAAKAGARMLFDAFSVSLDKTSLSLLPGAGAELKPSELPEAPENTKYEYTTEWKSSDENVAVVSGGKVTAKAKGTATITYSVTRKTTTTKTVEGESKTTTSPVEEKTMTQEEYQKYKDEILAKSNENIKYEVTEEKTEAQDGEAGKFNYKITIKATEKGESRTETTETTESASATCTVTVTEAKITSASLELSKSADSCSVGATLTVKPSKLVYTKEDGTTESVTNFPAVAWKSSDNAIATVDANGVVTGVKPGSVTITGTISGEVSVSATIGVNITAAPVLTLALDRTKDVYILVGGSTTLVATVANYKTDAGVTWESSDKKIATVDDKGAVTGVAVGSVKITATTKENGADGKPLKAECVVTVNSNAASDTTTKLKDKNGNQIYIKDKDGNYKEAVYADYYTAAEFYIRTDGQYAYTGWQTINGKTYYYDKNGNAVTGTQVIQGVTYNFGADGAIATTVNGATFGIDVSRHNGTIDWNAVKASGVDYVIIRCGYRGSSTGALIEDQNFRTNIKGATAAGLKVGVYVFSQAVDEVEAVKEASLAVSLVKGYNLTYPIFIDTESSGGRADRIDKATRTAVVNAFCQTVVNAGYTPGIYASKTWFEDKLNMGAVGGCRIWLAQYAAAPTYKGKYDMWQYSSKGKISGISGDVDLNYSYLGY